MSKSIEAVGVNAWYGSTRAIDNVTLTVDAKRVTAVIGPSGCGKSTFLRTLNRMHEVVVGAGVSGQVLLDGEDIYAQGIDATAVRRTVGMVFQRPNPFPTMSIRDNVVAEPRLDDEQSLPHGSTADEADQPAGDDADDTGTDDDAGVSRGHPNRPVMYASVLSWEGLVNIFEVGPISTR